MDHLLNGRRRNQRGTVALNKTGEKAGMEGYLGKKGGQRDSQGGRGLHVGTGGDTGRQGIATRRSLRAWRLQPLPDQFLKVATKVT